MTKADVILWLVVDNANTTVSCKGYSLVEEIPLAARRFTGRPGMRKVDNYQFDVDDLHHPQDFKANMATRMA